jgi:hypothetical protein
MIKFTRRLHARHKVFVSLLLLVASPSFAAEMIQVLPGTEVHLQLSEPLSSQQVRKGQSFKLMVDKDVRVSGQVVIPKGSEAKGVVVRSATSDVAGKPGELHVRIEYLLLGGRRIPLFSGAGGQGKGSEGAAVVLIALFGPVGMFKRGKEVVFPSGMPFLTYIDQGFEVDKVISPIVIKSNPSSEASTAGINIPPTIISIPNNESKLIPQTPITSENAVRIENAKQNEKL